MNLKSFSEETDAFSGEREKIKAYRSSILEAESSRLAGAPAYSVDEVRAKLKEKYLNV